MKKVLITAFAVLAINAAYANICNPNDPDYDIIQCAGLVSGGNTNGAPAQPTTVPLDGGVSLLIAAGIGVAYKAAKLKKNV